MRALAIVSVAVLAGLVVFVFTDVAKDMTAGDRLVGIGTLALAIATAWLGQTTYRSEQERRVEVQVLSASPLVVSHVGHRLEPSPPPELKIRVANSSERAVVDVRGTIRDPEIGGGMSPAGFGIVEALGGHRVFTFELAGFTDCAVVEIVIESKGLMGQRVEQRYDWRQAAVKLGETSGDDALVLTHLSVVPTRGRAVEIDARQ